MLVKPERSCVELWKDVVEVFWEHFLHESDSIDISFSEHLKQISLSSESRASAALHKSEASDSVPNVSTDSV